MEQISSEYKIGIEFVIVLSFASSNHDRNIKMVKKYMF